MRLFTGANAKKEFSRNLNGLSNIRTQDGQTQFTKAGIQKQPNFSANKCEKLKN